MRPTAVARGGAALAATATSYALYRATRPPSPAARLASGLAGHALRAPPLTPTRARAARLTAAAGLTGRWRKDKGASDDMTAAMDAVALAGPLRFAVGVLSILEVADTPDTFATTIKAGGVLDVRERYAWGAPAPVPHPRRDKRRGVHVGRVDRSAGGHPVIRVTWGPPHGGECEDEFILSDDGRTLTQRTTMVVDGRPVPPYDTVYRREG